MLIVPFQRPIWRWENVDEYELNERKGMRSSCWNIDLYSQLAASGLMTCCWSVFCQYCAGMEYFVSWWKTTGLSVSIRPLSRFILHLTCKAVCFLFFVWITNGCIKALVTAKLAFLLQFFMVLKTTDQWRSSWKILFNEHRFRASLYIIWLEAARCLWSAEHWIKLQINCSWCVERPLIILVAEARSENSVCSAPTYWRL